MSDASDRVPVHPTARAIIEAIGIPKDKPEEAALSPAAFSRWQVELKSKRQDKLLFVHLAVMSMRVGAGGVAHAAEQLMTLAKIGLTATELDKGLAQNEKLLESTRALGLPTAQGPRLAPKHGGGVGLRRGRKGARRGR